MRRLLRDVAEGHEPGDVTTLRDPSILAQLQKSARPASSGDGGRGHGLNREAT